MRNTFSILSEDNPGVLMRIASLIYRRGFNIASLSVGRTHRPGLSRFTIVVEGREGVYEQVRKQLDKLVEVVDVTDLTEKGPFVERWLSLIKVHAPMDKRPHVLQTAEIFRCRVVDLGADAVTLEVTGDRGKVDACLEALRPYGIIELAGSGSVAVSRSGFEAESGKTEPVSAY